MQIEIQIESGEVLKYSLSSKLYLSFHDNILRYCKSNNKIMLSHVISI